MARVETGQGWETAQERVRRITSARHARRKDLRPTRPATADTLLKDMRSQRTISEEDLRRLLTSDFDQPVVSLYLNLDPEEVVVEGKNARVQLLNSMRHTELAARRYLVDTLAPVQKAILERDLDELQSLAEIPDLHSHRSVVAFTAGEKLHRAAALHVKTRDSLRIDIDPYIAPLEALLEAHPPALVVDVEKEKSRFWSARLGELEEVDSIQSFVPPEDVDRGRAGKEQRHRHTHLTWHLKATSQAATRMLDDQLRAVLILAGDPNVLADFEHFLPERAAARLVGRIHLSPRSDRAEFERQVEAVLVDHRRQVEAAALDRLGEFGAAGVLVTGLAATLDVVNQFFVRRLFISADLQQPGYACREHHFMALEAGSCPFDDAPLVPVSDLVDELIEVSHLHGVELMTIETLPERLADHGGVAAVTYPRLH